MRILDGVVEPEAARLFAEMINSYRKHMQQRARRLRAIRRHLNKGADLRHIRDAKRARCFELGEHGTFSASNSRPSSARCQRIVPSP